MARRFREENLHHFWMHAAYFNNMLHTTGGRRFRVVHRGVQNLDAGPDFAGAVVVVDGQIQEGDVEIHLNPRDWITHGHERDPAYNRVILHISLQQTSAGPSLQRENGQPLPQHAIPPIEVETFLRGAVRAGRSLTLQLCRLADEPLGTILCGLRQAGYRRFAEKTERFRERIAEQSWDQTLYAGIAEALGYAKNQPPFRTLARAVPIDLLFSELQNARAAQHEMTISSLLFGAAGLLNAGEAGRLDAELKAYLEPRRVLWYHFKHTLQIDPLRREAWQFFRLRPANFPTRRIAALVQLVLRFYRKGMLETLLGVLQEEIRPKRRIAELRKLFIVETEGFWLRYVDFKSQPQTGPAPPRGRLIGAHKADEIIINVVLPILNLFASETRNSALANRIVELYANYPRLESNEIVRKMRAQLFGGRGHQPAQEPAGALVQQGMIQLHKHYCAASKCDDCCQLMQQI